MNDMSVIRNHFESEAQFYDELILKLIPFYKEMVEALISSIPFHESYNMKVLDLGCGTGTISKEIKQKFFHANFALVDIAEKMLDIAKNKINSNYILMSQNVDFYNYEFNEKYDVIISSLALHHLITNEDKQQFYKKIFNSLNDGGMFFNADVVLGSNDYLQKVYMEKWINYMKRKCDNDEIHNTWLVNYEKEDRPAKLLEQIQWLENIGFKDVDIIWKYYNFAVYGGYKRNT
jgi:tRNA (cmo5U34)-methyltransferase